MEVALFPCGKSVADFCSDRKLFHLEYVGHVVFLRDDSSKFQGLLDYLSYCVLWSAEKGKRYLLHPFLENRKSIPLTKSRGQNVRLLIKVEFLIFVFNGQYSLVDFSASWFGLALFVGFLVQSFCSHYGLTLSMRYRRRSIDRWLERWINRIKIHCPYTVHGRLGCFLYVPNVGCCCRTGVTRSETFFCTGD